MEKLGITFSLTSSYYPQANGQVECINQEISRYLQMYCSTNQNYWVRFLTWVEYSRNSLRHSATNFMPFQCVLGYQPPLYLWNAMPTNIPAVDDWFQRSKQAWQQAHQQITRTMESHKNFTGKRREAKHLSSPQVWLFTHDFKKLTGSKKVSLLH